MTFDKDAFHTLLSQQLTLIGRFYAGHQRERFRVHIYPGYPFPCHFSATGLYSADMSAHRRMARTRFLTGMGEAALRFEALLRAQFPALDGPDFRFRFAVGLPDADGERMMLALMGSDPTPLTTLPKVLDKLEILHARLAPVRKPTTKYLVDDRVVRGASPREALCTYLAVHFPHLYQQMHPDTGNSFTVSEIFDVEAAEVVADWPA